MEYFNKISESAFVDQDDGSTIYYPNGSLSFGRIIECEKRKKLIFSKHKTNLIIGILLGIVVGLLPVLMVHEGVPVAVAYCVLFVAIIPACAFHMFLNLMGVSDLPISEKKINPKIAGAKAVRSCPLVCWRIMFTVGIVMMPIYFTLLVWFPNQLRSHERTNEFTIFIVVLSVLAICQGWYGCKLYRIDEPTLQFRRCSLKEVKIVIDYEITLNDDEEDEMIPSESDNKNKSEDSLDGVER